jgi:hypothetical protein
MRVKLHRRTSLRVAACLARQASRSETNQQPNKKETRMKRTTRVLIAGAAMAGLMTGVAARTHATQTVDLSKNAKLSSWGQLDDQGDKGKHDCKGKNECKGQGGCESGDNGCKGKNSCKGHGGCNTNKPAE